MSYPFELKPLNYDYVTLEPFIDAETMELHHSKHLNTYVNNLNNALKDFPELHNWSLEKLIINLDEIPEEIRPIVRNNGGGIYNHNLFFDLLAKDISQPQSGAFYDAIIAECTSLCVLLSEFKSAGIGVFGSGWVWLVADKNGKLKIIKTSNQDVPNLSEYTPIINLDVWEHAYYLKNQNRRADYIDNWLNILDWQKAAVIYEGLKS